MIQAIVKQLTDGRWTNIDPAELWGIGSTFIAENGKTYKIIEINGSRVMFEEVKEDE